jgi:predicted O-linked N-acetylglucosamine transferase (SPINDLY family)
MTDLSDSATPAIELEQQAADYFAQAQYDQAAAFYEQLIEIIPTSPTAYWYLGLSRLLQGQESDAQMIWLMAIANAEEPESWTVDLVRVLEQEAICQTQQHQEQTAWLIRQHLREVDPGNGLNLLHLLQLAVKLDDLDSVEQIIEGLVAYLQQSPSLEIELDRLLDILEPLLDRVPAILPIADLVEAVITHIQQGDRNSHQTGERLMQMMLSRVAHWREFPSYYQTAYRYARLCAQLDGDRSSVIYQLCCICQDTRRYEEGIELAHRYYAACQSTRAKLVGNTLILRGLMNTGSRWSEAEHYLHQQTTLLQALLEDPQPFGEGWPDISILCTALFFYPYFKDTPHSYRLLYNQIFDLYQSSLNTYLEKHVQDYQPYPIVTHSSTHASKLKIGYISRFFYRHSIGWLSRWWFKYYDRDRFDVYTYFAPPTELDDFSECWFSQRSTSASRFEGDSLGIAKAIREDAIDVLVDLDSLTSPTVLQVMAMKPAPIQVTWLGWDASALPAIDYVLADPYVLPETAQSYYSEKIWRLPRTYIAVDGFEVAVTTLHRHQLDIPPTAVVYLSAQFAYKRHPDTVQVQMQILSQVPDSYFLIKGLGDQQGMRALFVEAAAAVGVTADRLRFLPRDPDEETHRANLAIADIILDTYPYNGTTTTLETLWMGIPLVTRAGQQFAARNSYTLLLNAGITEGIAWSDAEYIEWGVRLGRDANLRQQIALKLWRSRQTAPLWDGERFTRDLEHAYEQMWQQYMNSEFGIRNSEL